MTDIDPKSIPVLDDVIEDDNTGHHANDQHAPVAEEASVVETDELFSPASLLDDEISLAQDDIERAADIAALEGDMEAGMQGGMEDRQTVPDHGEDDNAANQSDEDTGIQPVSDAIDHTDAITALDESTPPGGDDLYQEDILSDSMDAPVIDSATGPYARIIDNTTADSEQASPSQQAELDTTAVTKQIIDRLMPEIEQRLRVIIDLTLREHLRDKEPAYKDPGYKDPDE